MPESQERAGIWLRITPEMPLLLGNQSGGGNFQQTADHLPGSMIRGAVAIELLNKDEAAFDDLFAEPEPHFGSGYYGGSGPVWPFPLTARECKRFPGLAAGDHRERHGVVDVMLADFAYDLISDPKFPQRHVLQPDNPHWEPQKLPGTRQALEACAGSERGGRCGEPVEAARGYYAWGGSAPGEPLRADPAPVARTTHVGINRARGVAQDRLLFTQERLDVQGTTEAFFVRVSVPQEKAKLFEEAATGTFYVGRGRSRGRGRVNIDIQPGVTTPSVEARMYDMESAVALAMSPYHEVDQKVRVRMAGTFFSLTLRSPAILADAGRPLRVPTAQMIGLSEASEIHCLRAWARMAQVGGWDSASGMPRRKALAARAGSVYLFWAAETVDEKLLAAELAKGELDGIGADRARGYGQISVCAPFHYI